MGVAVAFLAAFPVFAVNSTSSGMRMLWIGALLMLAFIGFVGHLQVKGDPEIQKYAELQRRGPYLKRYRPAVFAIVLGVLVVAELLAVAATYATPQNPLFLHVTKQIAAGGNEIFPLVGKYATQMTPPLAAEVLYKVQTVTTLFLTAGAIAFLAYAPYILCMPREEARAMQRLQERMRTSKFASSPIVMLYILVPFGILVGFALFLGWFEFAPEPAYLTRKKCLMKAACYAADDLHLIAIGFIRMIAYGSWLGVIIFMMRAFDREGG
ncbi:MAG: hypothetical protein ACOZAM_03660 [Pseudomonadota bacterium]